MTRRAACFQCIALRKCKKEEEKSVQCGCSALWSIDGPAPVCVCCVCACVCQCISFALFNQPGPLCCSHSLGFPDSVRVRAVVMTRDDSSGGWVPLGGGGLSHVVICKGRSRDSRGRREYIICGERLRDRAVSVCVVSWPPLVSATSPTTHPTTHPQQQQQQHP